MRTRTSKCLGLALCMGFAGVVTSSIMAQERQGSQKQRIEGTVRQFWQAVGETNYEGIKNTLTWPNMIQEVTPTSTGCSFIYQTQDDLEEEARNYQPGTDAEASQRPFADVGISDLKIEILNNSVASVTYECYFPHMENPDLATLSILTVLQKQPDETTWKIAYTMILQ